MLAKDCVEAVLHAGTVGKFVGHAYVRQSINNGHEFAQADGLNCPVDLAGLIADTDSHAVAATISGVFFKDGKYFIVVGTRLYPVHELRLQGVLSGSDVGEIAYVLKYLRKAVAPRNGGVA